MNLFYISLLIIISGVKSELANNNLEPPVNVNKCCEEDEIYEGKHCTKVNLTHETLWRPIFTTEDGKTNIQIKPRLVIGLPDCGSKVPWSIYHYHNSTDRLRLLLNGIVRHYYDSKTPHEPGIDDANQNSLYYDYEPGKYCLDKKIVDGKLVSEFALVCAPDHHIDWSHTEFLMRNIISPITHGIGIVCLLIIAIIYFIMPTLRDLVGNIITTLCMCLIFSQVANLIRLLTVFESHISRIIADTFCYFGLLGAFFWLNSLGYYIWKTFKSRNVFLRITDGKKYCYYSMYSWSCTIILGALAVFAHFTMDYPDEQSASNEQDEIGSLGTIIFFVPVAFTIVMDIFFFATTLNIINRMHTYGRIHHKLRHSFRMFFLLLLTMTITWLFFMMTFFKFGGLVNCYIVVNAFQGPLILFICIFNQRHVAYLVRKTCCYKNCMCKNCRAEPEPEWGDEMTAMNTGIY